MLTEIEAHRLAAAINQLRPEWPLASLSTFIRNQLHTRAYRDAAVALTWVATDPGTHTPARVLEAGPWWQTASADKPTLSAKTTHCPDHPPHPAWNCPDCAQQVVPPPQGWRTRKEATTP